MVISQDSAGKLVQPYEDVTAQMLTSDVNFWEAVQNLNIKTFSTLTKKRKVKSTDDKFISVGADRDLFECDCSKRPEISHSKRF